jgi:hypothetical protein
VRVRQSNSRSGGWRRDVSRQHGVEDRVELLSYVPGEIALGAGWALLHRYSEDDGGPPDATLSSMT